MCNSDQAFHNNDDDVNVEDDHVNVDDDGGDDDGDDDDGDDNSVSKDSFCCKGEPIAINARSTKRPTLLKELKVMTITIVRLMITMVLMRKW